MVPTQILLVLLSLSAGSGWAQSNSPLASDAPASSAARQPATSLVEAAPSSEARPLESVSSPGTPIQAPASSARPNPQETSNAAVSPSASNPTAPSAGKPTTTAAASQLPLLLPPPASSNRDDQSLVPPSASTAGPAHSNDQQQSSTPAAAGSVQGETAAGAPSAKATGTAAPSGSPQSPGSNGTNTRIGNIPGADSVGAGVATTSPSSPGLATTVSFAAQPSDGFFSVDGSAVEKVPESKTPTPPDVSTVDQFRAELTANMPSKPLTEKSARALAIMETAYFEYFVHKDPAPADVGKLVIPASVAQCQAQYAPTRKRSWLGELLGHDMGDDGHFGRMSRRDDGLRGFSGCKAVESLEVGVYFHYMRASAAAERPNELESRVKTQVASLNKALGAIKINFRYMSLNWWEPKANEDWTTVTRGESKLQEWQQRTRAPGKLMLTVWIVNGLRGSEENEDLNSYATFPNESLDPNDGVVIAAEHVQGGDSTTLIHDVGHWFGLGHTFGAMGEQCIIQDGLTNATQTSGMKDMVYECSQVPCSGGNAVEINNYMSYSACRGKRPQEGFSTDQKARMFANALQFRRGYEAGECMPDGKAAGAGAVRKRSSMQDILEGKCPDYDKQASILMDTPHSLGARVRAGGRLSVFGGGLWVMMLMDV